MKDGKVLIEIILKHTRKNIKRIQFKMMDRSDPVIKLASFKPDHGYSISKMKLFEGVNCEY